MLMIKKLLVFQVLYLCVYEKEKNFGILLSEVSNSENNFE